MLPILKVIVIVINSFSIKINCNCNHYIYFQEVIVIVMITFCQVITTSLVFTQVYTKIQNQQKKAAEVEQQLQFELQQAEGSATCKNPVRGCTILKIL